ncbi:MAG: hypothetical protein V4702_03630 [Patescibacteria group bacterium]
MDATKAKEMLDKIVGQVFGYQNPFSLEQFMNKFAFDVRLPQQVYDATTNQATWAQSTNPTKFITMKNAWDKADAGGWELPKRPLASMQDILTAWAETNLMATEREIDSSNVAESDDTITSENVYRSVFTTGSRNIIFSDGMADSEFVAASQRSKLSSFSIRIDDSNKCSNSFNVSWSTGITNSFFIQDCKDMQDSMFCSHLGGKRFYIANMQFEEAEYIKLRDTVIRWILTG